jgi:hypothetical protein
VLTVNAVSWPGEASRPIACPRRQAEPRAVLRCLARAKHRGLLLVLVGRSLATIGVLLFRARTSCSDCLASLRPTERSDSAPPLFADRGSGVERVQSWRVSHRARAEPCRHLGAMRAAWATWGTRQRRRVACKCRLGEARGVCLSLSRSEATSSSMPDTAPKTIRQPERLESTIHIRQPATFDACAV